LHSCSVRQAAGDEHRPRGLDGDHPRPMRRAAPPRDSSGRSASPRADDGHQYHAAKSPHHPSNRGKRREMSIAEVTGTRRRRHPDAGNLQIRAHHATQGRHRAGPFLRSPASVRVVSQSDLTAKGIKRSRRATSSRASRCDRFRNPYIVGKPRAARGERDDPHGRALSGLLAALSVAASSP
jgi:hypothetical protein